MIACGKLNRSESGMKFTRQRFTKIYRNVHFYVSLVPSLRCIVTMLLSSERHHRARKFYCYMLLVSGFGNLTPTRMLYPHSRRHYILRHSAILRILEELCDARDLYSSSGTRKDDPHADYITLCERSRS